MDIKFSERLTNENIVISFYIFAIVTKASNNYCLLIALQKQNFFLKFSSCVVVLRGSCKKYYKKIET